MAAVGLLGLMPPVAQAQTYGDPNSLVDYWYRIYLRRAPDPGGTAFWVDRLNRGTPPDQVLAGLLGSPEYYASAGSTPVGFITRLFTDILQRQPSPVELNYWVGRLYVESREAVADEVLIQNPGMWVGTSATAAPPVTPTPPLVVNPGARPGSYQNWSRDPRRDWYRYHDIHDYRRP